MFALKIVLNNLGIIKLVSIHQFDALTQPIAFELNWKNVYISESCLSFYKDLNFVAINRTSLIFQEHNIRLLNKGTKKEEKK
ncbi:CLUMA_CG010975, isoform A [Clunio marinus]|uniref:CLUMA_CG010975, isoform A n=1 Tax=Clunio marinus TaxID=568069 RepID=A0A1J1IBD2_9DIPT|nr:CLUMA_CG010975, isoform A [Clunio marinus]